ncbi:kin of IRRE-like protein 1 [Arctopsyche grandis]|uniref:kin of IRRE-like protein 1 n=1 Tax=Arctopsyche grandis TaxID=121162 RepID=UPI00406D90D0
MERRHSAWSARMLKLLISMTIMVIFVSPSTVLSSGPGIVMAPGTVPEPLQVSAVAGGTAELPCDVSPRHPNDSVLLVVWYRDDTPIYSWDARGGGLGEEGGSHWSGVEGGGRARWAAASARLALQPAKPTDRGDYHCRADFKASPSRNTKIHLQVIEASDTPRIFDERGKEIRGNAGPYREGDTPQLTCNVTGGYPPATVRWYRGGRAVEGQESQTGILRLPSLQRSDLLAELSCQASNSLLLPPTTATAQLNMHLAPLTVEVLEREPLSAGRPQEVICKARGGRPPPRLSWWLDTQRLDTIPQEDTEGEISEKSEEEDENKESSAKISVSVSTLKLVARAQQHGQRLTCRASHELLPSPMEALLVLNILFAPTVELSLGSSLNPNDIEEGDDVYFECQVRANPPPYKLLWEHDGRALVHEQRSGVLVSGNNLILRSVGRAAAGTYSCSASNVEGDARSQTFNLRIMYKPICSTTLRRSYGVARQEMAELVCEVEAVPPPDTFHWALNNSLGGPLNNVTPERYTWSSTPARSTLTYKPLSDLDYGTALCWATNFVGKQAIPCALTVLPASKPHPPANCSLTNQTSAALEILCDPGYDGGLQQWFLLEVFERPLDSLLANVSASRPVFVVGGLGAGRALRLLVYAVNTRGRSEPIALDGFTLELAEKQTSNMSTLELTSLVGMLVGAVITMIVLLVIFFIAFKLKHRMSSNYTLQAGKQKNHCTRTQPPRAQIVALQDDKNPDVVPLNKAEHKLTLEEPSGEIEDSLRTGENFVGPSHPPPYSSCMTTHLAHTPPIPMVETRSRAGREVVTTRAPLPAAQESDV